MTDRRRTLRRTGLKVGLIVVGMLLTNHFVIERLLYFWEWRLVFAMAVFLGIWLSAITAIFYLAYTPFTAVRLAWAPVVAVSSFGGDLFFRVTGDRLNLGDIEAMEIGYMNADEIVGLIRFYLEHGSISLLVTTLLCVGIFLPGPPLRRLAKRWLIALPFVPYLLLTGLVVHIAGNRTAENRGMPQQFHPISVLTVLLLSPSSDPVKAAVEIPRSEDAAARHLVLIIDESVRGDFIDIDGTLGVTPFLAGRAEIIVDFGLSVSGHNCSNGSNAILRFGANPTLVGSRKDRLLEHPSIWKYARAAGFETTYMDGQGISANSYGYMNAKELALIDTVMSVPPEIDNHHSDFYLAEQLAGLLEREQPQFVLLNKRGVHFSYDSRYPAKAAVFEPSLSGVRMANDRVLLLNSYKNAIKWNVDGFFERLLNSRGLANAVVIYTSDHGQNLMDDGTPVTHCRRASPILEEALVPLLVITRIPALHDAFREAAVANRDRTSGFQVFPTLLKLMGYAERQIHAKYYQDLFIFQETPLGFVSGAIAGPHARVPDWNSPGGAQRFRAATH